MDGMTVSTSSALNTPEFGKRASLASTSHKSNNGSSILGCTTTLSTRKDIFSYQVSLSWDHRDSVYENNDVIALNQTRSSFLTALIDELEPHKLVRVGTVVSLPLRISCFGLLRSPEIPDSRFQTA